MIHWRQAGRDFSEPFEQIGQGRPEVGLGHPQLAVKLAQSAAIGTRCQPRALGRWHRTHLDPMQEGDPLHW